ncbi:MAG: hypothetical protein DIU68_015955 [Chloroflexota bacterium]|nr:MAG: hypothetical protein DIU68_16795 [Chloroflexota bacterium]
MRRAIALLASVIVITFGFLTLTGLIVGEDLGFLSALAGAFRVAELTSVFLELVVVTVGVTIVIGILNLLMVHGGRVVRARRGWPYSILLLISALAVIALTIAERLALLPAVDGERPASMILLETVQVPVESALAALLLFSLVYGAYRLMHRRVTWTNLLFTLVLLVALLGALPLPGAGISLLASVRDWLMAVPVSAGARGLLLGIALATVVTGVRVLLGQDRSYRD